MRKIDFAPKNARKSRRHDGGGLECCACTLSRHRCRPLAGSASNVRACAPCDQAPPCGSALAWLRFPARLSAARNDRARAGAALLRAIRPAVLRSCLAALLSRALERWRLRPLLHADADRADVELRPVVLDPDDRYSMWPRTPASPLISFAPRCEPAS
jgi:hypothetical protein